MLRARRVNPALDPGGSVNELVAKGSGTVRARLATVRARLATVRFKKGSTLIALSENFKILLQIEGFDFINEIPLNEVFENLKMLLKKVTGGSILQQKSLYVKLRKSQNCTQKMKGEILEKKSLQTKYLKNECRVNFTKEIP